MLKYRGRGIFMYVDSEWKKHSNIEEQEEALKGCNENGDNEYLLRR